MLYNLRNGIIASPHEINSHLLVLLIANYTQNHAVTYTNQTSTHLLQFAHMYRNVNRSVSSYRNLTRSDSKRNVLVCEKFGPYSLYSSLYSD